MSNYRLIWRRTRFEHRRSVFLSWRTFYSLILVTAWSGCERPQCSHEWFYTDGMKGTATFCEETLKQALHGYIFRSALKFGLWYSVLAKEAELVERFAESRSDLESSRSRRDTHPFEVESIPLIYNRALNTTVLHLRLQPATPESWTRPSMAEGQSPVERLLLISWATKHMWKWALPIPDLRMRWTIYLEFWQNIRCGARQLDLWRSLALRLEQ